MDKNSKRQRYRRIRKQLAELLEKTADPVARMATVACLLYQKMDHFFWCGFYRLLDGELLVGPYQGSLACLKLKKHTGVCWAGILRRQVINVPDIHCFPGHIACDSRSKSEIVVPVCNDRGEIQAVLDVDSDRLDSFDEVDEQELPLVVALIYGG